MAQTTTEIPLSEAALRLRLSVQATLSKTLRGELTGRRDERGRWLVDSDSVQRIVDSASVTAA